MFFRRLQRFTRFTSSRFHKPTTLAQNLYGVVTPRPDVPDKTMPDKARRSQTKKWLARSGFLHQKFAGNFKKVVQMMPDSTRISLCLQKKTESGVVWHNLANFPTNFWCRKPAIFLSGSVWLYLAWFCLVRLVLV